MDGGIGDGSWSLWELVRVQLRGRGEVSEVGQTFSVTADSVSGAWGRGHRGKVRYAKEGRSYRGRRYYENQTVPEPMRQSKAR